VSCICLKSVWKNPHPPYQVCEREREGREGDSEKKEIESERRVSSLCLKGVDGPRSRSSRAERAGNTTVFSHFLPPEKWLRLRPASGVDLLIVPNFLESVCRCLKGSCSRAVSVKAGVLGLKS